MQFELFSENVTVEDNKYSKKVEAPQYVPTSTAPLLSELTGLTKYSELMLAINQSTVTDEEKAFLVKAATRHIVFNYAKIADYYAHATPEMQRLMEQSALVIIDVDDAIANGYVKLSTEIKKLVEGNKL